MRNSTNEDDGEDAIELTRPEGKASENALAVLHGVVSEYLTLKLLSGKATAAEVGAAITFLKNNSITADPATNAALQGLTETLRQRRDRKGGLTPAASKEAEEHFAAMMGTVLPGMQ